MFDINPALKEWRSSFQKVEQFSPDDIEEMENHLIDEIDKLKNQYLNEEEAFLLAAHRLGKPKILETEFHKVHPNRIWQNRFNWMVTGFLTILALNAFIKLSSKLIVFASSFFTTNFSILYLTELVSIGTMIFLIGWIVFKLLFSKKRKVEKLVPARLKHFHYIIIAFLVSFGQVLPEYLNQKMGSIHHTNYWEIWTKYGTYLSEIYIANYVLNFFFPLIILLMLITVNYSFKRVNG